MKNFMTNIFLLLVLTSFTTIHASKDVLHTIQDFTLSDGVLQFNVYSLSTDEEFSVGPTTYAINYNSDALSNPYLTNINSKFNSGSTGYGDMSVVISGGSILITINHTGAAGSSLSDKGAYGEVICTVGLNIVDELATAEISWNEINSAMFRPSFGLLDSETFNVVGEPNPPLPVELTSFTANIVNNVIELNWTTASELNNLGFNIERKLLNSEDGWKSIGFQKSGGDTRETTNYTFTDSNPLGGSYFVYRLKQVDLDGTFEYSNEVEINFTPQEFILHQNFPNPFNPSTKIRFTLTQAENVKVKIYDQLGQEVTKLISREMEAGYHEVEFDAANYASGIYFYGIEAGSFTAVKKMILLK